MSKVEIIKRPLEQVGADVKKMAWTSVLESLAILVLGILFVAWPDVMVQVVSYVVGAIFIAKGAFQIITYFMEKGQRDFFNNGLLAGTVSVLIGIAALVIGQDIANIFRLIVGVFLVYEALVRVNTAIKLNAAGVAVWKYVLVIALAVLVLGIFVTFNDVTTVIGWMMIIAGVIGVVGDTMFIQQVNNVVEKLTK
ncbi:DUF308 domain-containing protein [Candidatus Saccharibacteria bacterium]|nr:DUF308 domain-containing protein [Candidatus Saccharibacteria bacterium]